MLRVAILITMLFVDDVPKLTFLKKGTELSVRGIARVLCWNRALPTIPPYPLTHRYTEHNFYQVTDDVFSLQLCKRLKM